MNMIGGKGIGDIKKLRIKFNFSLIMAGLAS